MNELYRIKPFKMLAWWIACSLFVWPMAFIALAVVGLPTLFLGDIFHELFVSDAMSWLFGILAVPVAGAIIGTVIAFLQRRLLRSRLYWAADGWYRWTIIGAALGAVAIALMQLISGTFLFDDEAFLFMMPVFLAVVSSFQFIALRHAVKQAWLWIAANIIGGIVFAAIPLRNQVDYYDPNSELISLGMGLLAVVSLGFITGFVMLFLFEKKLLPMRPEGLDETIEADSQKPKSVWDRAI